MHVKWQIIIIISIYIALYYALLKAVLHKTNEILFNKGKENAKFWKWKTIHCIKKPCIVSLTKWVHK